jgi:hypothetical protein
MQPRAEGGSCSTLNGCGLLKLMCIGTHELGFFYVTSRTPPPLHTGLMHPPMHVHIHAPPSVYILLSCTKYYDGSGLNYTCSETCVSNPYSTTPLQEGVGGNTGLITPKLAMGNACVA